MFLPSEAWRHSGDRPDEWKRVAGQVVEHVGPDGCDGDDMLREPHVRVLAALLSRPSATEEDGMQLTDHIDRHAGLSRERFEREYLRPASAGDLDRRDRTLAARWARWSPQFFKEEYGHLEVEVDGESMALGDLIDRVEASTDDNPAPYLRNQALAEWPPELTADVSPMPDCTRPNWLESRFFPVGRKLASVEVYIGGQGAQFPALHYDGLHTHAFLMQLYGDKEYIAFSPEQTPVPVPDDSIEANKSRIDGSAPSRPRGVPAVRPGRGRALRASSGRDALRAVRLVAYGSDLEPVGDRLDQWGESSELLRFSP